MITLRNLKSVSSNCMSWNNTMLLCKWVLIRMSINNCLQHQTTCFLKYWICYLTPWNTEILHACQNIGDLVVYSFTGQLYMFFHLFFEAHAPLIFLLKYTRFLWHNQRPLSLMMNYINLTDHSKQNVYLQAKGWIIIKIKISLLFRCGVEHKCYCVLIKKNWTN